MINPISHGTTATDLYKVEPYVVAADVYGMPPHEGRGGWSWYTGSAGWMYQLIVESLLGVQRTGTQLRIRPLLPADWTTFSLDYRFGTTLYRIALSPTELPQAAIQMDGVTVPGDSIGLVDDGVEHQVKVHWPYR
jgi:cellobiose phosphorylase